MTKEQLFKGYAYLKEKRGEIIRFACFLSVKYSNE